MSLLDQFLVDGALFIDNSTLEKYNECPRAFEYRSVIKRVTAVPQPAPSFGSAIHKALEYRYRRDKDNTKVETEDGMIGAFGEALAGAPIAEDDYRNYDYGINLIRKYNTQYGAEAFEILETPTGEPMVELPFAIALGIITHEKHPMDIPVIYTGRIDLGIRDLIDQTIWVMDHKTNSIVGDSFYAQQVMSAQQEGYCYAHWRTTGIRPEGSVINMLATRRETKYGKGIEFNRQRGYLSEDRLWEWEQNTLANVYDMVGHLLRGPNLPMRKNNCVAKYGRCQFYDVCSLPREQRSIMLDSNLFTTNTWSPLHDTSKPAE